MQSPERLQARLEELAGGVEKERALVTDAERRSRDLQARMDTIAKVCCHEHQSYNRSRPRGTPLLHLLAPPATTLASPPATPGFVALLRFGLCSTSCDSTQSTAAPNIDCRPEFWGLAYSALDQAGCRL